MDEILDINSIVSGLVQEISLLREKLERVTKENAELHTKVQQLEESISLMKGGKNSRSSSTAPSQDLGRSNQKSLRQPSGKQPGGQTGHSGHTLSVTTQVVIL